MPRPVCPNMTTATHLGPPGAQTAQRRRRSSTPGRSNWTRSHPLPGIHLPEGAARKVLPRCGGLKFRTPPRHRAPNLDLDRPGRTPIPGDGAAGDQRAQDRPACPAMAATTPAACPVSTTSWRYDLRRTCRLVTGRSHRPRSTWPDQARLPLLTVTHRYKRAHCLWLEQFQIADYLSVSLAVTDSLREYRTADSGRRVLGLGLVRADAECSIKSCFVEPICGRVSDVLDSLSA